MLIGVSNISAEGLHFSAFHCVSTRIYIEDMRTKKANECAVTSERIVFS